MKHNGAHIWLSYSRQAAGHGKEDVTVRRGNARRENGENGQDYGCWIGSSRAGDW